MSYLKQQGGISSNEIVTPVCEGERIKPHAINIKSFVNEGLVTNGATGVWGWTPDQEAKIKKGNPGLLSPIDKLKEIINNG